jgi:hypothetical protein
MGELFPGCPAIVPASAPLIEKHEKESSRLKAQATAQTVLPRWIPPLPRWEVSAF